jgi:hypothetical protein
VDISSQCGQDAAQISFSLGASGILPGILILD